MYLLCKDRNICVFTFFQRAGVVLVSNGINSDESRRNISRRSCKSSETGGVPCVLCSISCSFRLNGVGVLGSCKKIVLFKEILLTRLPSSHAG